MKKNLIFAIDVDDTVGELVSLWIEINNVDNNDTLRESDILDWNISAYAKCGKKIYDYLIPEIYDKVKPVQDALWGVNQLRQINPNGKIIFITSDSHMKGGRKLRWLNENGFNVARNDYFETSFKYLVGFDYLLDDCFANVKDVNGGILYNRKWNEKEVFSPRVLGWNNLIENIDTIAPDWRKAGI